MFDVVQFLKDYHIQYWTEGSKNVSPGWVNTRCVFCGDTSNHLGWPLEGGYLHCWKCGVHSFKSGIRRLLNVPDLVAQDLLSEYSVASSHLQSLNKKRPQANRINPPGGPLGKFHRAYLDRRGFDPDSLISKYHLTGTGPGETWEGIDYELRIIVPIHFYQKPVSFQGRDITDRHDLRYKGCPIEKSVMNYKHILYGIDQCQGTRVVVVEGIVDVWRLGDGFAGSFGTSMTSFQTRLLTRFDEVLFLFDGEPEAQAKAKEYASELASMGKYTEVMSLGEGKDPGDLNEKEAGYVRKQIFGGM